MNAYEKVSSILDEINYKIESEKKYDIIDESYLRILKAKAEIVEKCLEVLEDER